MFSKYILVGIINTIITATVIFILMSVEVSVYISNALGYALGIVFSFIVNTLFTFSSELEWSRFFRFLISCLVCYVLNLLTIYAVLLLFPDLQYTAQIMGMGIYTLSGFLINKLWVMR